VGKGGKKKKRLQLKKEIRGRKDPRIVKIHALRGGGLKAKSENTKDATGGGKLSG